MKLKIGIIGSRGIPNHYGGFEECAQQLAVRLVKKGHQVTVYNSHRHPYEQKEFDGVSIVHKYDAQHRLGSFGQFIYDFNCIYDARSRGFQAILILGYTSSSIWQKLFPAKAALVSNMDGLEWKRSKYSPRVRQFLLRAEAWAAKGSDILIADAQKLQEYLNEKYRVQSVYIPYGASPLRQPEVAYLEPFKLEPRQYNLTVARLEPENNLELMLSGVQQSLSEKVFLVIGNHETPYGEYLKKRFRDSRIRFLNAIYDKPTLDNLRHFSHLYFHGHSVGGTNPALLEAMACRAAIVAHRNPFNLEVLGKEGNYFIDDKDVVNALDHLERNQIQSQRSMANLKKIKERYNWDLVAEQYEITLQQAVIEKGVPAVS